MTRRNPSGGCGLRAMKKVELVDGMINGFVSHPRKKTCRKLSYEAIRELPVIKIMETMSSSYFNTGVALKLKMDTSRNAVNFALQEICVFIPIPYRPWSTEQRERRNNEYT